MIDLIFHLEIGEIPTDVLSVRFTFRRRDLVLIEVSYLHVVKKLTGKAAVGRVIAEIHLAVKIVERRVIAAL